jgi:hypothetical protein
MVRGRPQPGHLGSKSDTYDAPFKNLCGRLLQSKQPIDFSPNSRTDSRQTAERLFAKQPKSLEVMSDFPYIEYDQQAKSTWTQHTNSVFW